MKPRQRNREPNSFELRSRLRRAIDCEYPNMNAEQVFQNIKKPENQVISFNDLEQLCFQSQIPTNKLSVIFDRYNVVKGLVTKAKFTKFYYDELSIGKPTYYQKPTISEKSSSILSVFVMTLIRHKSGSVKEIWKYLQQRSTKNEKFKVRVALLVRIYDEYNLQYPLDEFIDALFEYLHSSQEEITLEQFSSLINDFC